MNTEELANFISAGFEQAKAGDAARVYNAALPYLGDNRLPAKSHYPFGWVIYYALHQAGNAAIVDRKRMLAAYLKLEVAKPHKLHSMILTEAIRLYKDAKDKAYGRPAAEAPSFSILRFMDLWDYAHLREGDWRRKTLDDKTLGSTVEKLITVCVDELEASKAPAPERLTDIIDRALAMYPDTPALLSQRAWVHAAAGQDAQAKDLLRRALIIAPGKFYLWARLARLMEGPQSLTLRMALLYKALRAPGQEQFKGRIRMDLALAWLEKGYAPQAKWEADRVAEQYKAAGWHPAKALTEAQKRIPDGTVAENPEPLYRKIEHLADDEVYAALPEIAAAKTYHKNPGPAKPGYGKPAVAWRVTDAHNNSYWLQPHRFGLDPSLPMGTPILIRIHNGKPVKARLQANF